MISNAAVLADDAPDDVTTASAPAAARDAGLGRLTRRIVDDLGSAIVTGRLDAGRLLPVESELSARYAASRTILREAVKVLNSKGLVAARPRRGTWVTPPSNWNLFDPDVLRWTLTGDFSLPLLIEFTLMRLGFEPVAAALAAGAGDPKANAAIRAGLDRMRAAARGDDDPLDSDIAFHLAILDAGGNRFFAGLKPLVETALRFSIRYTDDIARDEQAKVEVHAAVLDAIERGDPGDARRAAQRLLLEALDLMGAREPHVLVGNAR